MELAIKMFVIYNTGISGKGERSQLGGSVKAPPQIKQGEKAMSDKDRLIQIVIDHPELADQIEVLLLSVTEQRLLDQTA